MFVIFRVRWRTPVTVTMKAVRLRARRATALEAVYYVVERFSLRLGQIAFLAKMDSGPVKFSEDAGGLARPLWTRGDNFAPRGSR